LSVSCTLTIDLIPLSVSTRVSGAKQASSATLPRWRNGLVISSTVRLDIDAAERT
jgi:hypothetical protein